MERTIVFYHGGCPDGFGGAYAAWKKLGDTAEYIPLHRGDDLPDVTGANVYFIDFVYEQDVMDALASKAGSLTALDHHEGVRTVTESMPNFVFDNDRSGATLAWDFFHEGQSRPKLLEHIQDDDLFLFKLPDTRAILSYIGVNPFTFEFWDQMAANLEGPQSEALLIKMRAYGEYFELLAQIAADNAKLVEFEGYQCYFATAHPYKPMKSLVGNLLYTKHPPFRLVVYAHSKG